MLLTTLETQHARIVLMANHEGVKKYTPCLNVGTGAPGALAGCVAVPDDAVHTWESEASREALVAEALALARSLPTGHLFIVCAGPLSKPLINALWVAWPHHQYIDMGSSMDEILKGRVTRPYMDPTSPYAKGVDPQWFCHRGAAEFSLDHPSEVDFSQAGIEGKCHQFSIPEGER